MKKLTIYVPGIMNFPNQSAEWNNKATIWSDLNIKPEVCRRSHSVEYFCGPVGRAFGQKKRAQKVVEILSAYKDYEVTLVGHSNGAAVILAALDAGIIYPTIRAIHLVSAACEADFEKNGLNDAIEDDKVGVVHVYCGGKDWALRIARHWWARCLGYGTLGLHGAKNVRAINKNSVVEHRDAPWSDYGHSTCFEPARFDRTMRNFVQYEELI